MCRRGWSSRVTLLTGLGSRCLGPGWSSIRVPPSGNAWIRSVVSCQFLSLQSISTARTNKISLALFPALIEADPGCAICFPVSPPSAIKDDPAGMFEEMGEGLICVAALAMRKVADPTGQVRWNVNGTSGQQPLQPLGRSYADMSTDKNSSARPKVSLFLSLPFIIYGVYSCGDGDRSWLGRALSRVGPLSLDMAAWKRACKSHPKMICFCVCSCYERLQGSQVIVMVQSRLVKSRKEVIVAACCRLHRGYRDVTTGSPSTGVVAAIWPVKACLSTCR